MRGRAARAIAVATGTVALAVTAVALGAAIVALRMARSVVMPPREREQDVPILAVDLAAGTIRLGRTPDTILPGRYGLWFDRDRGHLRVGGIVAEDASSVTRVLDSVQLGDPLRADRGRWSGWWHLTPDDLGLLSSEVAIQADGGPARAWRIDAEGSSADWVVQVHGRAASRAEALRAVPVFREAGFTSLLISYRNDAEAPPSPDGRYALGDDEWRDVEAAIRYARAEGAQRIVLMGWSMGGATVLQTITRSPLAVHVIGVVLESPVVDWVRVLRFQAEAAGLPAPVRDAALWILGSGRAAPWVGLDEPIDFARLDIVARAAELSIPMLILHSDADGFVPSDGSVALAAARPDVVRLERFTQARHTKLWNHDPARWERAIRVWLTELRASRASDSARG